jgi:hypothetical protein
MFRPNRLTLIGVAAALVCLPARVSALQRPAGAARVAPDFDIREGRAAAPNVPQGTNGARVHRVRFDRTLDGIPVFDASEVSGTAIGDDGVQATPAYLRGGIVGAEEAVRLAAGNVRASLDAFRPVVVRREPGPELRTTMAAGPLRCGPIASLVYFLMDGQLRSAWHVVVEPEGVPAPYDILVDARTGRILFRQNRARMWR